MNLVSLDFIIFLFIILVCYYLCPKRYQWLCLLVAGVMFYISYVPTAITFILASTVIVYIYSRIIMKKPQKQIRKGLCAGTIGINIIILLVLKYSRLIVWNDFIVPLGISFYTLQLIGYCVDIYQKKYEPENNFLKLFLFVSYFPHILQGPIARYQQLAVQLKREVFFDYNQVKAGAQLMLWGYFQKMIIADRAAVYVDKVFNNHIAYSGVYTIIAIFLYSVQLYADFSGCVNIVTGVSQMFGIDLMKNFRQPYFAVSIQDFWRRWHISLSSWLRDYVYIPLGGNRKGIFRKYGNILIVFLVSGIWHGAGATFVFWGAMHGIYQIVGGLTLGLREKIVHIFRIKRFPVFYKAIQIIFTYLCVSVAWVFFKAKSVPVALKMLSLALKTHNFSVLSSGKIFTLGLTEADFIVLIISILLLFIVDLLKERNVSIRALINEQNVIVRWAIYLVAIFAVLILGRYGIEYDASNFIYMNF